MPFATASDTNGATVESGEPQPCAGIASTLWYSWSAPADAGATVVASTNGSSYDTALAVYTGSDVTTLTWLGCDDDNGPGYTSLLSFVPTPYETYRFQVGGYNGATGDLVFQVDYAADNDGDGWDQSVDCNDADASIYPGAYDTPNDGIDQDCNGSDAYDPCYPSGCPDNDADGWNSQSDCNDADASVYPGAADPSGDGIDQNCDGFDGYPPTDNDADGWTQAGGDCDDYNASIYPGAYDTPNDGIDQDCDGWDAGSTSPWISYFDPANGPVGTYVWIYGGGFTSLSQVTFGGISVSWDYYNDGTIAIYVPSVPDGSYGIDVSDGFSSMGLCCFTVGTTSTIDNDADGWTPAGGDCNDYDWNVHPGAYDYPDDGIDQDCDGWDATNPESPLGIWGLSPYAGASGTQVTVFGSDFYDVVSVSFGGTPASWWTYSDEELAFMVPDLPTGDYSVTLQTNEETASWCCFTVFVDADHDGWPVENDCDDNDWSVNPGAPDQPYDGVDSDCDGVADVIPPFEAWMYGYLDFGVPATPDDNKSFDGAAFGVADNATTGFDVGVDSPQPPAPPQEAYASLFFEYPDNAPGVQDLSVSYHGRDVRATYPLTLEWTGAAPGAHPATLAWYPGYFDAIPSGWSVLLVDGATIVDMRMTDTYSLDVSGETGSASMMIVVSTAVPYQQSISPGWNLVSLPVTPFDMTASAVYGPGIDAVYAWENGTYVPVTTLETGVGYWIHNTGNYTPVTIVGEPVVNPTLELAPGWNLIGSGAMWTTLDGAPAHVSRTAFAWGNGYFESEVLYAGYGFWVYSHELGATVQLGLAPPAPEDVLLPAAPVGPELTLGLAVVDASGAKDAATLVAKTGATSGFEGDQDVMEAPRPAASVFTQAYFAVGGMQQHVAAVAPASEAAYTLRVERIGEAGLVTIDWTGFELPEGYLVELVDGATRVDMSQQTSYAFTAPAGASVRALQVTLRPADAGLCLAELDGRCLAALPAGLL